MNCNTTHYRANSSSVPGDPTRQAALQRLDELDGTSTLPPLPPRVALYLPANGRDVLVEDPGKVVRIIDPAREKAARKAGLGEREALEAARMTDDEIEAVNQERERGGEQVFDPTLNANAGVPDPEATP